FGSFAQLIGDLDRVARAELAQDPPDYAAVAALAVARQTARELMLDFPVELLVAWVRLGEVPRVLASVAVLGRTRGRASEPMLAVAGELLAMRRRGIAPGLRPAAGAADLLQRAIGALALVRSTTGQLDALGEVAALLAADRGIDEAVRLRLAGAAIAWVRDVPDDCLRAAGLGAVASALAGHDVDRRRVEELMAEAT